MSGLGKCYQTFCKHIAYKVSCFICDNAMKHAKLCEHYLLLGCDTKEQCWGSYFFLKSDASLYWVTL